MLKAVYVGSFDPFTIGHLNVLTQAAKVFNKVYVSIAVNSDKKRRTDANSMKDAIDKMINRMNIKNVEVVIFDGLTVELARKIGATFLIRGLRNGTDYEYEENIAVTNNKLGGIETIYFRAGQMAHISSSIVMELYRYGQDISNWVPIEVLDILKNGDGKNRD